MVKKENKFSNIVALLFFALLAFSSKTYSQEEVIHINADLITVPVSVLDRNGRYLSNLKKENFQIFENGIEQEINLFEAIEQPITIFFLLDTSKSMKNYMSELVRAANAFLNQLRPNNQLIVASFCDYTKTLQKAASVAEVRSNKIKLKSCGKATMLYEAVDNTLKKMKKIQGRKAIVLFSDGIDSGITTSTLGFFVTAKDNLRDAEELDALIYTIRFGAISPMPPKYANKKDYFRSVKEINNYIQDIAQKTGGRHYKIENISNLEETFKTVAQELGQQYSLGYYPKETGRKGERRQIKVKVNVPDAAVRARSSYVVGDSKNK